LQRTTSYGFLATLSSVKPIAIAQQGRTDLWPESSVLYQLKNNPKLCIQNATLIHVGTSNDHFYGQANVDMDKVKVDLSKFHRIPQILRKSMRLSPVPYRLNTVMLLF
jgi:hypothetical protein